MSNKNNLETLGFEFISLSIALHNHYVKHVAPLLGKSEKEVAQEIEKMQQQAREDFKNNLK